jgi:hypothetical protein
VNGESPDLEVAAGARAAAIRWRKRTASWTHTSGDVEAAEATERHGAPERPEAGRQYEHVARGWRFAVTLREALRSKRE